MSDLGKNTVAVVFDFDDTLAPDSTSQLLVALGVDPHSFWRDQVEPLVGAGWDPVPAYLYRLLEHTRSSPDPLTRKRLQEIGSSLELYPGVADLFDRLRAHASSAEVELNLEFYIVSSGLQTLIDASPIRGEFTQVWASDLHHAEGTGEALFPSNVVSFTDKTRYLFHVHKRLIARRGEFDPFEVNRKLGPDGRCVPFDQMIYVGDGYNGRSLFLARPGPRRYCTRRGGLRADRTLGPSLGLHRGQARSERLPNGLPSEELCGDGPPNGAAEYRGKDRAAR